MTTSPSDARPPRPPWLHTAEVAKPGDWLPEVQHQARKNQVTLLPKHNGPQAVPAVPDSGPPDTVDLVTPLDIAGDDYLDHQELMELLEDSWADFKAALRTIERWEENQRDQRDVPQWMLNQERREWRVYMCALELARRRGLTK